MLAKESEAPDGVLEDEQPPCLLCGAKVVTLIHKIQDNRLGVPGTYSISRCSFCNFEQIYPRPEPDQLKQLYEEYYNFAGEKGTTYTKLRQRLFDSSLYRLWLALDGDGSFHGRKGSGRLLDIGCNEGRGLKIYRQNGFIPEGLELNAKAADVARSAGFKVYEQLLHDFQPRTFYDVVVLSNVLEHSLDPKRMLLDISRILRPGGQVWISCPNSGSWIRKICGHAWINWHVPFHISHFSEPTLRMVLTESGFVDVKISQVTPALWVASSLIAAVFSRKGRATRELRNPALVLALMTLARTVLCPLMIAGNLTRHGDCLIACASRSDDVGASNLGGFSDARN